MQERERTTPPTIRVIGRALNATVARAPWLWPALRPAMSRYFDRRAAGWDERTSAGSVDHLTALAAATTRVDREPERILELGTGTGEGALFLAREFPRARIRGVDISPQMVRLAQAKVGLDPEARIAFRQADAGQLPYDAESFDLVVGLNMPPFFAEMARVLRPGGCAIVASSWGEATPFFTPEAVLERGFASHGMSGGESGRAGAGTWYLARKDAG